MADNPKHTTPWRRRLSALKTERTDFEPHWEDIADYIAPAKLRLFTSDRNDGGKKYGKIVDETALLARRDFVSGMMAGLTSPARPWFKLGTNDKDLNEFKAVKEWLETVERRMMLAFSKSNLYQALPNVYDDVGTFGTAAMGVNHRPETMIWCRPFNLGEYWVATNEWGLVDTFYRRTTMTVGQLVKKFGRDNVSRTVGNMWDCGDADEAIPVIQAIEPNDGRIRGYKDAQNMPFRSVWFEEGESGGAFLEQRGFEEFPIMAPRWYAAQTDSYGVDCPGMLALGGTKQLQHEQRRKAEAIDKMVKPPMVAPSAMQKRPVNLIPGGMTFVDEVTGGTQLRPAYAVDPRIGDLKEDIREVQQRIKESYFVDLFRAISMLDRREITAREIQERHEEKLLMLGPTLQRMQSELFDPLIDRTFSIMTRPEVDVLPPPPEEIQGMELRVEYVSMLAQAQQSVGVNAIERTVGFAGNLAAVNPAVLDKIDFDQAVDEYASIQGVPQSLVRSDEDVEALRASRAQQEQAQQAMAMAQPAVQSAKVLSETKVTDGGTALDRLLGGV